MVLSGLVGTASAHHQDADQHGKDTCNTESHGGGNGNGANDPAGGDYASNCDEDDFGDNGNGNGGAGGKPCAGCVGNADNKNPPGQARNGGDGNSGYECDGRDRRPTNQNGNGNHGIGDGNPAHSPCVPGGSSSACPSGAPLPTSDQDGDNDIDAADCNVTRTSCPANTTWTDTNNNGKVEPSECDSDDDDDDCVGSCGGSRRSSSVEGDVLPETEETGEVQGVVLTSQETPPAGEVQGTELPRTGVSSTQLALVGLGLVLLGLGTTLVTRREPAVI